MNPNFGEIEIRTNAGDSWYSSGQVEVERKIHTLVLRAAYTYSKFLDDTSDVNQTTGASSFSAGPDQSALGLGALHIRPAPSIYRGVRLAGSSLSSQCVSSSLDRRSGSGRALPRSNPERRTPWRSASTISETATEFAAGPRRIQPRRSIPSGSTAATLAFRASFPERTTISIACFSTVQSPCPAEPISTFHFIVPTERSRKCRPQFALRTGANLLRHSHPARFPDPLLEARESNAFLPRRNCSMPSTIQIFLRPRIQCRT